jgi:hypothetical protein
MGDPVFAQFVFLLLHMNCPVDYRVLIWRELYELLPTFDAEARLPYSIEDYCEPTEQHPEALEVMRSSIDGEHPQLTRESHPQLFYIVSHHLYQNFLLKHHTKNISLDRNLVYTRLHALYPKISSTVLQDLIEVNYRG